MLFIGPPFGNYFSYLSPQNTKTVKGSYTLHPRPGLIPQIFATLRYSFVYEGWINKIGLRNPGIDYGIKNYKHDRDIISIAILEPSDIEPICEKLPENANIEINVSCPNTEKHMINTGIQKFINPKREWCIIKCSPKTSAQEIKNYYNAGFRQFHFSNTLPTPTGGLSGHTLIPYTQSLSKHTKETYKDSIVICGGGIQSINDIANYNYGDHHSISTLCFNPFKLTKLFYDLSKK
jgi:dihydroorotate dehydrogenase